MPICWIRQLLPTHFRVKLSLHTAGSYSTAPCHGWQPEGETKKCYSSEVNYKYGQERPWVETAPWPRKPCDTWVYGEARGGTWCVWQMWTSSVWILRWRLSLGMWYISNCQAERNCRVVSDHRRDCKYFHKPYCICRNRYWKNTHDPFL